MTNLLIGVAAVLAACTMYAGVEAMKPAPHEYQCGTDSECEAECRKYLRPDEDPSVCDVDLSPVEWSPVTTIWRM